VAGTGYLERPRSSSLADVIEIILDKGIVIDAYVRVSLVGIEVLTIDARIVIASVDTYLRFAEATNRLDLTQQGGKDLPDLMESLNQSGAKGKTSGALAGVKEAITGGRHDDDDGSDRRERRRRDDDREPEPRRRSASGGS
jgi:hypothetical protein